MNQLNSIATSLCNDGLMPYVLSAVGLVFTVILIRLHRDKQRPDFDLTEIIMQHGRVDKFAFWLAVVIIVLTWMMIYMVTHKTLTEGYLGIYVASIVAPLTAKVIWGKKPDGTIPQPPDDKK